MEKLKILRDLQNDKRLIINPIVKRFSINKAQNTEGVSTMLSENQTKRIKACLKDIIDISDKKQKNEQNQLRIRRTRYHAQPHNFWYFSAFCGLTNSLFYGQYNPKIQWFSNHFRWSQTLDYQHDSQAFWR
jgi:hypothetical protein